MPNVTTARGFLAHPVMAFVLIFTAASSTNVASVPQVEAKMLCKPVTFYRKHYRTKCEEDICGIFSDMAINNAGSKEGSQQAIVAGACLLRCAVKAKTVSYRTLLQIYGSRACTR